MTSMHDCLKEVAELTKRLEKDFPKETESFLNFFKEGEAGPALPLKYKELTNVALSVAVQCEWCIAFHVRNAVRAGATRQEIIEAGFQAVIMRGGPAFMWMTPLTQAVDEFAKEDGAARGAGVGQSALIAPAAEPRPLPRAHPAMTSRSRRQGPCKVARDSSTRRWRFARAAIPPATGSVRPRAP